MKILIADDHPVVRRGIKSLLEDAFPKGLIGEASNVEEAIETACRTVWDIVLLDLSMPGVTGLEGLIKLSRACPTVPILVLSMHSEEQFAIRALKSGAAGYLMKDRSEKELVKAVQRILAGRRYMSAALVERLALDVIGDAETPPHDHLSQQEYRVMYLIGSGKSVSQIAQKMNLSVKTISTYRTRVLEKMEMKGNVDMMRYCMENRLVEATIPQKTKL
jgi:DNA-binding NarL/FixJ family response regulator